jgi:hypothetical protein
MKIAFIFSVPEALQHSAAVTRSLDCFLPATKICVVSINFV